MARQIFEAALLILMMSGVAMADAEMPLTIAVSNVGNFRQGGSWYLSVNSAGEAELVIEPGLRQSQRIRRRFEVTKEQLEELRVVLDDVAFFELADDYGELVPDGSCQTLTIVCGERVKSVKLHFLMNWVNARDRARLREPSRALRPFMLVRGWFNDPEAVDHTRYDQRVLDVMK